MEYTLRTIEGERVANTSQPLFWDIPVSLNVMIDDLLSEIGFISLQKRNYLSHKHNPDFLVKWVSDQQILLCEYREVKDQITLNKNKRIYQTVMSVLSFVRDVYQKGS